MDTVWPEAQSSLQSGQLEAILGECQNLDNVGLTFARHGIVLCLSCDAGIVNSVEIIKTLESPSLKFLCASS